MRVMSKSEVRTVLGAICVLAIIGAAWFGLRGVRDYLQHVSDEGRAHQEAARNQTFRAGEWARLDSREDERRLEGGGDYEAAFGWKGRIDFVVDGARVISGKEAKGALGPNHWGNGLPGDDASVLVVSARIKNVDATPSMPTPYGHSWFLADAIRVSADGSYLNYFDGAPEEASEDEWNCIDLPKGQTKSVVFGYSVPQGSSVENLHLYAGYANLKDKYRFELT